MQSGEKTKSSIPIALQALLGLHLLRCILIHPCPEEDALRRSTSVTVDLKPNPSTPIPKFRTLILLNSKPSMLQDVEAKRLSEIDAINGMVVTLGEENSIETPFNLAVSSIIKAYEEEYK